MLSLASYALLHRFGESDVYAYKFSRSRRRSKHVSMSCVFYGRQERDASFSGSRCFATIPLIADFFARLLLAAGGCDVRVDKRG